MACRSAVKGFSPGHTSWMISRPGSSPCEWTPISRPPGRNDWTRGATTFEALNSRLALARYGWEAVAPRSSSAGDSPWARQNRIEEEGAILAPEHQDDGPLVDGVARGFDPGPPVLRQKPLEIGDLLGEAVRSVAGERDMPSKSGFAPPRRIAACALGLLHNKDWSGQGRSPDAQTADPPFSRA